MNSTELEEWNPLWRHLRDSAAVAGRLWESWLPTSVRHQIADVAGGDTTGRTLLAYIAGVHDIGKATPAFAVQVPPLADEMRKSGLAMPVDVPERSRCPHGLAGQVILERWLQLRFGWTLAEAAALGSVVGGHHGVPPSGLELERAREPRGQPGRPTMNGLLLGTDAWEKIQHELLDHMAEATGALPHLAATVWRRLPSPALSLMLATTVVSDWLASNTDLFPLTPMTGVRPLPQPDADDVSRLENAWESIELPEPWAPHLSTDTADSLLADRFTLPSGTRAHPVQVAAVEAARAMDPHGILMIEAPMGEGKTEAAMLAAEILAARSGVGGAMVALPTQATSDAMFTRLMRWVEGQERTPSGDAVVPDRTGDPGPRSVYLAHGKAWLNPDFTAVPRRTAARDIGRDQATGPRGGAYVDSWMTGRHKGVLADFVVGTIDHVLFSALQTRHVALRHLAFARKVVILDEIHSYDAYMNTYLERTLEWLGSYGTPVVALSATLPPRLREGLVEAYRRGRSARLQPRPAAARGGWGRGPLPAPDTAPRAGTSGATHPGPPSSQLTYVEGEKSTVVPVPPSARTTGVRLEVADDGEVATVLAEALADGGCALVVRNTVGRAQETYQQLTSIFGQDVSLLHSRFLASDRKTKERRIVEALGAPHEDGSRGDRPQRLVVVGTQVVEQSLDVDFDLLITDLAPIDLLLQRVGRIHRHDRPADHRPPRVRSPRTVVVGVEDLSAEPPQLPRGSKKVYGQHLLLRTAAQVERIARGAGVITLPDDIAPLVHEAYGQATLGPDSWQQSMEHARLRDEGERQTASARAEAFRLRAPGAPGTGLVGWLDAQVGDPDVEGARAQVRDADDALEVLVVVADTGGQWHLPAWIAAPAAGAPLPMESIPSTSLQQALAGTSVRLPGFVTAGPVGDAVIAHLEQFVREAWQDVPHLAGELVLPLDVDLCADLPGVSVQYDVDLGLLTERTNRSGELENLP